MSDATNVAVIGELRTFTLSSQIEFSTANVSVTPIDASRTAVKAFGRVTYRPGPIFGLDLHWAGGRAAQ